jgi:hypothetical protein
MYPGWSARDNYAIHKKRRKRKVKQVDSKGEEGVEDANKESKLLGYHQWVWLSGCGKVEYAFFCLCSARQR